MLYLLTYFINTDATIGGYLATIALNCCKYYGKL